jgi:hypothetical protein
MEVKERETYPTHRTRRLPRHTRIRRRLRILASTPADDVGVARAGRFGVLSRLIAVHETLSDA